MSSGNFTEYGVGDWYADLCNIIKLLKINQCILIGSSMGMDCYAVCLEISQKSKNQLV